MNKSFLLTIACLFMGLATFAQAVETVERIEMPLKDGYNRSVIHEFGEKGFIHRSVSEKEVTKGKLEWKYDLYNTDLELTETLKINIDKKAVFEGMQRSDEDIHMLYRTKDGAFQYVIIDIPSMDYEIHEGFIDKKMYISHFKVLGEYAFLKTNKGNLPYMLSLHIESGRVTTYPIEIDGFSKKETVIHHVQVLEDTYEVFAYVKATKNKKNSSMFLVRMNEKGKQTGIYPLNKGLDETNFMSASASVTNDNEYILTGTYSNRSSRTSEGMYIALMEDEEIYKINLYNFLELDNFLNYLPEKQQEKIEKKKAKKDSKGKDMKVNYLLAAHNIIHLDDGYLFLAEAYYPTYRTETYYTTNSQGQRISQTRQVFDGYQYTHAMMARFNKNGDMQWDQSFEMYLPFKPYSVRRFIRIADQEQSSIKLAFTAINRFHTKTISYDGAVLSEEQSDEITTENEGDDTKKAYSNVSHWYDQYFLAYGAQKIKNKEDDDVKRKRKVYFINKIAFE